MGLNRDQQVDRRKRREENEELLSHARVRLLSLQARAALNGDAKLVASRKPKKPTSTDMFALPEEISDGQ
jgi:hypothetical protein